MEHNPKPYIVFWISQYNGSDNSRGSDTPKFKPNMTTFATYQQAEAIQKKLAGLAEVKGTYRSRVVVHVSSVSEIEMDVS